MSHYSSLPQFEDIEIQRAPASTGSSIQTMTISKETKEDGSIVRRKETVLASGQVLVEERVLSSGPQHLGTRFLSTSPTFEILPSYHQRPSKSKSATEHYQPNKQSNNANETLCKCGALVVVLLITFQLFILICVLTGRGYLDDMFDSIREFILEHTYMSKLGR